MNFNDLLISRRSIRSFNGELPSLEELGEMIDNSFYAPSWKNSQTARYYVASSEELGKEVYDALPDFNQRSSKNSCLVVTTFKKNISGFSADGKATKEDDNIYGAYDLGLNNAYFVLKANDMGYDTLIMGLFDEKKLKELFLIPDDEEIMVVIAVGKRVSTPDMRSKKTLEEVCINK